MRETDIRPAALLETYLDLSRRDAETFFPNPSALERAACPGCGADTDRSVLQYAKHGFDIVECGCCLTLFVNPRPSAAQLAAFYRDSPSTDYWAKISSRRSQRHAVKRSLRLAPRRRWK